MSKLELLFKTEQGTQINRPLELEVNEDTVYIRKNIERIADEDFEYWEYEEAKLGLKEYIQTIGNENSNVNKSVILLENKQAEAEPFIERIKTAVEVYEELKENTNITLDDLKIVRISALKEECNATIEDGFTVNGARFGFNTLHDQANFTQQLLLIVAGQTTPIQWKTKNLGVIELTVEQFRGVVQAAEQHKRGQQARYWDLEQQVISAETKEEVKSILW